jgi:hypothetical protein
MTDKELARIGERLYEAVLLRPTRKTMTAPRARMTRTTVTGTCPGIRGTSVGGGSARAPA